MKRSARLLLAGLVLFPSLAARSDVVHKRSGGKVTGTIVEEKTDGTKVTIRSRFGTIEIPRSDIDHIDYVAAEPAQTYKDVVGNYKETAEDQMALALWCLEHKYKKEYQKHLEAVIRLDPDDAEARRRLGYRLEDGKWLTLDEIRAAQGYVKHQGKYILPQEKERDQLDEVRTKSKREFLKNIKMWRTWLRGEKPEKREKAQAALLDLRDPEAVGPLMDLLGEGGKPDERLLLVAVLSQIEGPESTAALLRIALEDDVKKNRWAAIDALSPRKSPALVTKVTATLKDEDNDKVRRAADLLGEIGDETVVPALIDALVTTHAKTREIPWEERIAAAQGATIPTPRTTVMADGTLVRPSFRSRGAAVYQANPGGLSVGSPTTHETLVTECKNVEVRAALTALTEQDFAFDQKRWLAWVKENHRAKAAKISN